jgi:riboflavin-specific deaminase-like protein
MRQLLPEYREDADPADVYEDPMRREVRERPFVFVNMVASVDGATVVQGVTEKLGSPGDRHIFFLLRSMADAILVGAETVRAEGYGPPKVRKEFAPGRAARGQSELPRIAIVTRSLQLDWDAPLFADERSRPFILAPASADPQRLERAAQVADVIAVGQPELDLPAALRALATAGVRALLCEGGPTLNASLLSQGLIDELCLTISPVLVGGGGGATIVGRALLPEPVDLTLAHLLEEDGSMFCRYLLPTATAG